MLIVCSVARFHSAPLRSSSGSRQALVPPGGRSVLRVTVTATRGSRLAVVPRAAEATSGFADCALFLADEAVAR